MKFLIILSLFTTAFGQNLLHQPENIRLFADHLFCSGDYLRAIEEYQSYLNFSGNDTIEFKIILSLNALKKYDLADKRSARLINNPHFRDLIIAERLKNLMIEKDFPGLRQLFDKSGSADRLHKKLRNFSFLYARSDSIPSPPYLSVPFSETESRDIYNFYDRKINLPEKDPALAGFLSIVFPGAGKIYTEEYGDAFLATLATGVFSYLAYSSFKADHKFRGYLFSGVAAWFYAGGIYGSIASAQIFNARIHFSFTGILDNYLKAKNYFLPDYGFCQ